MVPSTASDRSALPRSEAVRPACRTSHPVVTSRGCPILWPETHRRIPRRREWQEMIGALRDF